MPKRISRDGSIVEPHAIKLEEMYRHIFDWFKTEKDMNKTDVIRNAVEVYCSANGGKVQSFRDMSAKIDKTNIAS